MSTMIRDAIAKLRLKLVDLTNRNRLLNFRFSDSSRKYIRVIDEVPGHLYARLTSEDGRRGRLYFAGLPEPPEDDVDPDDTGVIGQPPAAIAPRAVRVSWRNGQAGAADRTGTEPKARLNLAQWARENGIDPSYDLPEMPSTEPAPQHVDTQIQTLMLPEALSKKMARIRDDARVSEQELGVSTLYAAFGFLEWYEDRHSSDPRLAPLFLLPVQIDRELKNQQYQYYIECGEGADPVSNISLRERLKRDFGFLLPDLEEEQGPEEYLRTVQKSIDNMPRWKVRRFVVIGHFSFARLAMYEDLDPARWAQMPLEEMNLIQALLAGSEPEGDNTYAEDVDPEADEVESLVPALIVDADSSQYSAIVDAMRGRSFALKGPPGTGKSQTITNLIAAAMAANKKVLFVAEKLAALEVVAERLTEAGLGPFILELHSTKSQKKKIAQSFEERLAYRAAAGSASGTAQAFLELKKLRTQLRYYATLLNTPVGASDLTLHQVIWFEQRCRVGLDAREMELSDGRLEGDAASKTPAEVAGDVDAIRMLVAAVEAAAEVCGDVRDHPLYGLTGLSHDVALQEAIRHTLTALTHPLDALVLIWVRLKERLHIEIPSSLQSVESFAAALKALPSLNEPTTELFKWIRNRADVRSMLGLIQRIEVARTTASNIGNYLRGLYDDLDKSGMYAAHARELKALAQPLSCSQLSLAIAAEKLTQLQVDLKRVRELTGLVNRWCIHLGLVGPLRPDRLKGIVAAVQLLHESPSATFRLRNQALYREEAREAISKAKVVATQLKIEEQKIKAGADLNFTEKPSDFLSAARVIANSGIVTRMFSSQYRAAKRLYKGITRARWNRLAACQELRDWADALKRRQEFESSAAWRDELGPSFAGLGTPFDSLLGVHNYWRTVRTRWPSLHEEKGKIQQGLLSNDVSLLEDVRSSMSGDDLTLLRSLEEGPIDAAIDNQLDEREKTLKRALEITRGLSQIAWLVDVNIEAAATLCTEWSIVADLVKELTNHPARTLLLHDERLLEELQVQQLRDTASLALAVLESTLPVSAQKLLLSSQSTKARDTLNRYASAATEASSKTRLLLQQLEVSAGLRLVDWIGTDSVDSVPLEQLQQRAKEAAAANAQQYTEWANVCEPRSHLTANGALSIADAAVSGSIRADRVEPAFKRLYYRGLVHVAAEKAPELRSWNGVKLQGIRARLAELDRGHIKSSARLLIQTLASMDIPRGVSRGAKRDLTERALIENEVGKQTRHIPIRVLLSRAFNAAVALKPCFMMSPASASQFLSPNAASFDLVVIDEASQMRPEDAVASLARAKQLVVVGDPMQLPPTTFFDSVEEEPLEDQEREDLTVDTESILDLGLSKLRPARDLRWHYRSRHESLIAFSNQQFYGNRLIVFPSPVAKASHLGIQFVYVSNGFYRSSLNQNEALEVVKTVQALVKEDPSRSIGVVSMNQPQRDLLADEFDRLCAQDPAMEAFRARWKGTLGEFFINNLENVQGHERDVIVISTVYGRSGEGAPVFQRFGPINTKMGHRRLNVLFTRAKQLVVLVSSMQSEDIKVEPTSTAGVLALKNYLEYARSGRLEGGESSGRSFESPFEVEVAEQLTQFGHRIEPQVGVAGYFIDMAVRHPAAEDHYVLGIECDGATYHSAKCARDRDRLRQEILERLGWRLHRIWSADWYHSRAREVERLKRAVAEAIERAAHWAQPN